MALEVEDGTGKANAESYISVADATTYHADRGNTAWASLASATQEQLLRKATEYMLGAYRERWTGMRVGTVQALDWPRAYVPIKDAPYGYGSMAAYVPNNVVPTEVKRACAELALIANSGPLAPNLERGVKEEVVGPIEVVYDEQSPEYPRYVQVDRILSVYLSSSSSSARLVRT